MYSKEFKWGYLKAALEKLNDSDALKVFNELYGELYPYANGLQVGDVVEVLRSSTPVHGKDLLNKRGVVVGESKAHDLVENFDTEVAFTEPLGLHTGSNRFGEHYWYFNSRDLRRI